MYFDRQFRIFFFQVSKLPGKAEIIIQNIPNIQLNCCLRKNICEMIRFSDPPGGCIIYFMLSIVINLFILILRISAHELQNNSTLSTPTHRFDAAAVMNIKTTNEKTSEIGE